ncbi:MAG: AAA family ATPase [Chloroflexi bacterium]|nr:AAA family ATPase [Chloroflexota bacterium]
MSPPALVSALLGPQAYPSEERPQQVVLVETHISYLFLTGRHVYKVKKPVDFGFLDFTTLEKRKYFCHEEVRLNQRLSPGVYLDVVEIRGEGGRLTIGGQGLVVEYAVKMRQLPAHRAMSALLARGQVDQDMVRRLASRIFAFHQQAERGPHIAAAGTVEAIKVSIDENFQQTDRYIGVTLAPHQYELVRAYSYAFMEGKRDLFSRRAREGFIRDCHGDLHTAQIFFEDGISVIDCIEFNTRFRYIDVASDLAFLAMDLDFDGAHDLSRLLVETYQALSGDTGLADLLDFYRCYRAYVRGKVESFRLDQTGLPEPEGARVTARAGSYFALAARYAAMRPPYLILAFGLMGTGKSTLAGSLAKALGAEVINSDMVRKELAGVPPTVHRYEPWDTGIYTEEFTRRTYEEMLRRASALIAKGRGVVLDASFSHHEQREAARALAAQCGVPFYSLCTHCPPSIVRERLVARQQASDTPSDGRWELFERQVQSFDPPETDAIEVDTSVEPRQATYVALAAVFKAYLQEPVSVSGERRRHALG